MTQKRLALDCELLREAGSKMRINSSSESRGILPCHSKSSVSMPQVTDKLGDTNPNTDPNTDPNIDLDPKPNPNPNPNPSPNPRLTLTLTREASVR